MDAPTSNRPPASSDPKDPFASPTPSDDDGLFVTALQNAGLLAELDDNEFLRIIGLLPDELQGPARRMQLLSLYFQAGDDPAAGWKRTTTDRYFIHRDSDMVSAQSILRRVCALAPEVGQVTLERIGEARYGQLVLKNNEHVIAVVDDDEADDDDSTVPITAPSTVTVRGIVRAMNTLMQRAGVRIRLVPLASNDEAEAYIAMSVRAVMDLAKAGFLDEDDPEELMEFAGW